MNSFVKTFFLMFLLLGLMMAAGRAIGGNNGMILFFLIGLAMNFVSYWFSDKIILMMYRAKEMKETENPKIYSIVRKLTQNAVLPMPKIYLMNSPMMNAFATGRNPEHSAVAVTAGILDALDERELSGVLGHELSHVKNRDILIATVAAAIAGAIMMMSRSALFFGYGGRDSDENRSSGLVMIFMAILAPIAAMIIQMAISRSREYAADKGGSEISRDPLALASALKKLQAGVKRNPVAMSPATAHLFIVSPLSSESFMTLFSTHPPISERVKRLEAMASQNIPGSGPLPKVIY